MVFVYPVELLLASNYFVVPGGIPGRSAGLFVVFAFSVLVHKMLLISLSDFWWM